MNISSVNLGYVSYSKNPKFISIALTSDIIRPEMEIGVSRFSLEENISLIVSLKVVIFKKDEKEDVAKINIFTIVEINLEESEIKQGESIKKAISYFALTEAWPIFESKISMLQDIKISFAKLPPMPTIDNIQFT